MTFSQQINKLFAQEKWAEARPLLEERLKKDPQNHWLLTRLGTTYYEEGDYERALALSMMAYELQPDCPLVLWDLANSLEMVEKDKAALGAYQQLIGLGPKKITQHGECGEGKRWGESLLVDCLYSIAGCLHRLGHKDVALSVMKKYLEVRGSGIPSIYTRQDARNLYEEIAGEPVVDLVQREVGEVDEMLEACAG